MPVDLRLIHISDLHLGRTCQPGQPFRKGRAGHSNEAVRQLDLALKRWLERDRVPKERTHIVVSGDITTTGASAEDEIWRVWREEAWCFDDSNVNCVSPLGEFAHEIHSIPGNHDLWASSLPVGLQSEHDRERRFGDLPWVKALKVGSAALQLCGLDSYSVSGRLYSQVMARGIITEEDIGRLRGKLDAEFTGAGASDCIRLLVLHHSPTWPPPWAVALPPEGAADQVWETSRARAMARLASPALRLSRRSRRALSRLLAKCGFHGLLTGHTHVPCMASFGDAWEINAGTCTQQPVAELARHSFVVHDFEQIDRRTVRWNARLLVSTNLWEFVERRGLGFQPVSLRLDVSPGARRAMAGN